MSPPFCRVGSFPWAWLWCQTTAVLGTRRKLRSELGALFLHSRPQGAKAVLSVIIHPQEPLRQGILLTHAQSAENHQKSYIWEKLFHLKEDKNFHPQQPDWMHWTLLSSENQLIQQLQDCQKWRVWKVCPHEELMYLFSLHQSFSIGELKRHFIILPFC